MTMTGLDQIHALSVAMSAVLKATDAPAAGRALGHGLSRMIPSDQWWIIFYVDDEAPVLFDYYDSDTRPDNYSDGPYIVCPFYNAIGRGIRSGCNRLSELASVDPSQFSRYAPYYHAPLGPLDEIGLFLQVDDATTAVLSLARSGQGNRFDTQSMQLFQAMAPMLNRLVIQLWEGTTDRTAASRTRRQMQHSQAIQTFSSFGADVLTTRELELAQLLLRGFSAKEIARFLDITEGTARNHMKQVYGKMGVNSQASLCGILIEQLLNDAPAES